MSTPCTKENELKELKKMMDIFALHTENLSHIVLKLNALDNQMKEHTIETTAYRKSREDQEKALREELAPILNSYRTGTTAVKIGRFIISCIITLGSIVVALGGIYYAITKLFHR